MSLALDLARSAAEAGEVPVGAVVVSGSGSVLGTGCNAPVSLMDPTGHAEILALRRAAQTAGNYRLIHCTLYATMEPCIMCAGALLHARIRRLVYGAPDLRFGAVDSLHRLLYDPRLNHRVEVIAGVLEEECRRVVQGFFEARRR